MARLIWGRAQQLSFANEHEYYQALGSLCHPNAYTITFETNSETYSWGDAFRIKCLLSDNLVPDAFIDAMRNARRINCNDYVQCLYEEHNFDFDIANKVLHGDYHNVKRTVPTSYYQDFDLGYNLQFTRYNNKKKEYFDTSIQPSKKNIFLPSYMHASKNDIVIHKSFGEGKIVQLKKDTITIKFGTLERYFKYPECFDRGFLKMKEYE